MSNRFLLASVGRLELLFGTTVQHGVLFTITIIKKLQFKNKSAELIIDI